MTALLTLCFLFFVGSCIGWCIEVVFRRIFTAKKWINPGFLTGPYLPLYGFGVVGMYLLCLIPIDTGINWLNALITVAIIGVVMTLIEYIAGLIFIKGMRVKLWDYSDRWGNIQGIICPLFSFFWLAVGALYYFVIDPFVIEWVEWFVSNMPFAFVVGFFFGVFTIDLCHSVNLTVKIRKFAADHNVVVRYEKVKESIRDSLDKLKNGVKDTAHKIPKPRFFSPFKGANSLEQALVEYLVKENAEREKPHRRRFRSRTKRNNCENDEEENKNCVN
ncbi:MAG: putative ABC transporter permease [Candidatus Coproplasma sp.]